MSDASGRYEAAKGALAPTRITCGSYDEAAEAYAAETAEYANFPGLEEEVMAFESMVPAHALILDLGCGGGRDGRLLAKSGRRVVAADYSERMLERASAKSVNLLHHMTFARCDMLALPFGDERFGGTWASASLLHLPLSMIPRALEEILRTLVIDGVAAISMRSGDFEGWRTGGSLPGKRWFSLIDPGEFVELMERVGFRETEVRFSGREGWFVAYGLR